MLKILPGLVIVALLALTAEWLGRWTNILGVASWCIFLGAGLRFWPQPVPFILKGGRWAEKYFLQAAIVLMGLQISLDQIKQMWLPMLLFLAVSLCLMAFSALPLPKLFDGVDRKTRWLLAAGESVCGSAAIAALSGPTRARSEDAVASILIVNLFSTLGLILLPVLLSSAHSSSMDSAWWTGGYLQSAGHALAAGFSMGEESGLWATAFKMERILLLVPLLWISRMVFSTDRKHNKEPRVLPAFIWIFLAVLLLNHFWPMSEQWKARLHFADQKLIHMALCAIGLNIDVRSLFRSIPPVLGFGLMLTLLHLLLLFFGRIIWTVH